MASKASAAELSLYRWHVASRVLAAVLGGYVLTSLIGIFLSLALPLSRSDSVNITNTLGFAFYTGAIIWVFSVATVRRAWLGLVIPSLVLAALIALVAFTGGHAF